MNLLITLYLAVISAVPCGLRLRFGVIVGRFWRSDVWRVLRILKIGYEKILAHSPDGDHPLGIWW